MSILNKLFGSASKRTTVQKPSIKESLEIVGLIETGKYEQAIVGIDYALKSEPQNSNLWFLKGSALFKLSKYIEALNCLEKSTKLDPISAHGWGLLGEVSVKLNRMDDAINAYKQYLTVATSEEAKYIAEVTRILAGLEKIRNTSQVSIKPLEEKQAMVQKALMIKKAMTLMEARKYEQAIVCYDEALQILPGETKLTPSLLILKSDACEKLWKWQDVLECCNKVIDIVSSQSEQKTDISSIAWFKKGLALEILKRDQEALICYDNCLQMNPSAENLVSITHNRENVLARLKKSN
jgi:tetratricopeptide (TPR) repeat protein